jgi:putative nucleotidyltransferase with HDIG domain
VAGPWDAESELRLKQILYRCMEELEATKAALYLSAAEGHFKLLTSYGFGRRDTVAAEICQGHPIWDWVRRHRTQPMYLNSTLENPDLAPILEGAGTARMLTVPIIVGDRLVGFIDSRDKAKRQPYTAADVSAAKNIAAAIEVYLRDLGYSTVAVAPAIPPPPPPPPPSVYTAATAPQTTQAQTAAEPPGLGLSLSSITDLAGFLRTCARMPGVGATALTVTDGKNTRTFVLRTVAVEDKHKDALLTHHAQRLEIAGVKLLGRTNWTWDEQDSGGASSRTEEIRTAMLLSTAPTWVVLSVLSPAGVLAGEAVVELASQYFSALRLLRNSRRATRNLARVLLEPGETAYPHLRQHSQAVSEITQKMAALLKLGEEDEEQLTIGGYLHDVGMRELDYARVYRMERPTDAEQRMFQRHSQVGARILENAEYPGELAKVIRHHHERWDGNGYPGHLAGRAIPLGSRVIHLAEVYDTLTSPNSYRRPIARDAAIDAIRAESGKQFDAELIPVLEEAVRP